MATKDTAVKRVCVCVHVIRHNVKIITSSKVNITSWAYVDVPLVDFIDNHMTYSY